MALASVSAVGTSLPHDGFRCNWKAEDPRDSRTPLGHSMCAIHLTVERHVLIDVVDELCDPLLVPIEERRSVSTAGRSVP